MQQRFNSIIIILQDLFFFFFLDYQKILGTQVGKNFPKILPKVPTAQEKNKTILSSEILSKSWHFMAWKKQLASRAVSGREPMGLWQGLCIKRSEALSPVCCPEAIFTRPGMSRNRSLTFPSLLMFHHLKHFQVLLLTAQYAPSPLPSLLFC